MRNGKAFLGGAFARIQLVSARYERGSIILTSNKSYGDWGGIFGEPIIKGLRMIIEADEAPQR